MTEKEMRVTELEFYTTLQLLYSIKRDANFLVTMLEGLRFIVPFNMETVIKYANKFNLDILWQPYQGELLGVLYSYSKFPVNALCKAAGISRPTGYTLIKKYLEDPYISRPKVPKEDIQDLKNVVDAYIIFRKEIRDNG
jgi:hypothetical protein